MLTSKFTETEHKLLDEEIIKKGGFRQVDFGGIAIINLPKDKDTIVNIDEIFRLFNFSPTEIKD